MNRSPNPIADTGPKSKLFAIKANGADIDIVIIDYSDRLFIILTQFGSIGTLISVERSVGISGIEENSSAIYDLRTLFGDDRLDYHVTVRSLAESIAVEKPLLFAIALKDTSFPTVELLRKAILENKIW